MENGLLKVAVVELQVLKKYFSWLVDTAESLEIAGSIFLVDLVDVSSIAVSSVFFTRSFKCSRERYQTLKAHFMKLSHGKIFIPCTWCILDAVKTVLIRRFGKLWTSVSRLSFDQCSYHDCTDIVYSDGVEYDERFLDFVHNVLILHENPTIDQSILKLDYNLWRSSDEGPNDYVDREMRIITDKVNSWIHFAMRKGVELLHLDFKGCGELEPSAYILPDVVMNCQYLTQLKLVACEIIPTGQ
ncbi:F-box protein [Corchorus olitorius]|uniref:F-box protein n=1 Tax=Corchorus olitorius TaxID=93759 RepID=A0A1R3GNC4_9ROSI|nr:F-box protein [Corchorus olitorius]